MQDHLPAVISITLHVKSLKVKQIPSNVTFKFFIKLISLYVLFLMCMDSEQLFALSFCSCLVKLFAPSKTNEIEKALYLSRSYDVTRSPT